MLFGSVVNTTFHLVSVEDVLRCWKYDTQSPASNLFQETWLNQQIIKLLAAKIVAHDQFLILDSSTMLNYDFDEVYFLKDGSRFCYAIDDFDDQAWELETHALLGLDTESIPVYGFRSVNQIFLRKNVFRLVDYLEKRFDNTNIVRILQTSVWTEYNLYGLFCKCILNEDSGHHFVRVDDVMFVTKKVISTTNYISVINKTRPLMIKLYQNRPDYTLSNDEYQHIVLLIKNAYMLNS